MADTDIDMRKMTNDTSAILIGLTLLVAAISFGCNGAPNGPPPATSTGHTLSGVLVKNMDTDATIIVANLLRSSKIAPTATIVFNNDTLFFDDSLFAVDSVYSFSVDSFAHYPGGEYVIDLSESSAIIDTFASNVADTFFIEEVTPFSRIVLGNGQATLDFTNSNFLTRYVVAAVKAGYEYSGVGWSTYTAQNDGSFGIILPDAFLSADSLNPDTGLYNLYAYAIWGAPDSALSANLLPVPLPDRIANNIDQTNLTGNFGSVVVTRVDTVRVRAN